MLAGGRGLCTRNVKKMEASSSGRGGPSGVAGAVWCLFSVNVNCWQGTVSCLELCGRAAEVWVGWPGAGSWTFLLATVSSSFGILSRQKYFPVSSLQTLTRSQLQVGSAFLLSGITMNSILEPLVTHLLQHLIDSLVGGALGQGGPGESRKGDGGRGSLQRLRGNSPRFGKAVKRRVPDTRILQGSGHCYTCGI